jgi:hypothetical protein
MPISGKETPSSSPAAGGFHMCRSIFIAIGIMAVIIGIECMVIESANLYSASETRARTFLNPIGTPSSNTREWRPQEWFPWTVLSAGVIIVLYSFTLPQYFEHSAGG